VLAAVPDVGRDEDFARVDDAGGTPLAWVVRLFQALKDRAEVDYLNDLSTSFALPETAVDRLRAAAGAIILGSPEFQRLLRDTGARVVRDLSSIQRPAD